MAINFENALGIHQYSVGARSRRAEILASNIANADTPGYKARDIDFATALKQAHSQQGMQVQRTDANHIGGSITLNGELLYRVPLQPDTGDGNTVELQHERSQFMQNSLEYQASLTFLDSKFSGLRKAIKGDQS